MTYSITFIVLAPLRTSHMSKCGAVSGEDGINGLLYDQYDDEAMFPVEPCKRYVAHAYSVLSFSSYYFY